MEPFEVSHAQVQKQMFHLGGESAFTVALAAAALEASTGLQVSKCHLGDVVGLKTPKAFLQKFHDYMKPVGYGPAAGLKETRKALAKKLGNERGINIDPDCISIQTGGKPGLAKLFLALVGKGTKIIIPSPGYPIYQSWVDYLEGEAMHYSYFFKGNDLPTLDLDAIRRAIERGARLLVLNDDNNPTGITLSEEERQELVRLCIANDVFVISDEPYFNIRLKEGTHGKSLAAYPGMEGRVAICGTYSKEGIATGDRVGWIVAPRSPGNPNTNLLAQINHLNGNIESCTSTRVQLALLEAVKDETSPAARALMQENLSTLKERGYVMIGRLRECGFCCPLPEAGFYAWADATAVMRAMGMDPRDVEGFRKAALEECLVSFCTEVHFCMQKTGDVADKAFVRFAFSGMDIDQIRQAMNRLESWIIFHKINPMVRAQGSMSTAQIRTAVLMQAHVMDMAEMTLVEGAEMDLYESPKVVVGAGIIGQTLAARGRDRKSKTLVTRLPSDDFNIDLEGMATYNPPVTAPSSIGRGFGKSSSFFPKVVEVCTQDNDDEDGYTFEVLRKVVGPDTVIAVYRNGVDPARSVAQAFPDNPVLSVVISVQIYFDENQVIHIPKELGWDIGVVSGGAAAEAFARTYASNLNKVGTTRRAQVVAAPSAFREQQWRKYFKNQGNAAALYLGLKESRRTAYEDVVAHPQAVTLMNRLTEEAYQVFQRDVKQQQQGDSAAESRPAKRTKVDEDNRDYLRTAHIPTTVANWWGNRPIENLWRKILLMAKPLGNDGTPGGGNLPLHRLVAELVDALNEVQKCQRTLALWADGVSHRHTWGARMAEVSRMHLNVSAAMTTVAHVVQKIDSLLAV